MSVILMSVWFGGQQHEVPQVYFDVSVYIVGQQ